MKKIVRSLMVLKKCTHTHTHTLAQNASNFLKSAFTTKIFIFKKLPGSLFKSMVTTVG